MPNDAGTAFLDIRPDLKGFNRELSRGVDGPIDKSARNAESKFSGAFGKVAKIAGGVFAAKLGVDLFKDVIGGASDLNETISKSNTIFGKNAKEIENWAGTAAKSMGQSKQGALDAAATFGNLFVQLGTGSGEAAKMSKEMVGLASDFASFHNADPTDVITSMTAAFRGEYDAVQRYVPTITAAAVEQKALKMGLAGTTKELTAQHKALATQALLVEGAGDAMGDFARTSDGLANRQRILSAQFQDMKDRIGTALLPVVLRLMEGFVGLGRVIGPIKDAARGLFDIFAKGDFTGGFEAFGIQEDSPIIAGLFKFRDATKEAIGGVRALGAAFKAGGDDITSSGFAGVLERIGSVARMVVDTAVQQFGGLVAWFKTVWPQIQEAVGHGVAAIQAIWRTFGDEILAVAQAVWNQIRSTVETAINVVRGIIQTVLAVINGDWGRAWDGIKLILSSVWEHIRETVVNAMRIVREVVEAGLDVIRGVWERVWSGISGFFSDMWEGLKRAVRAGVRAVVDVFLGMVETVLEGGARMLGWVPGIGDRLKEARDSFREFRDSVNRSLGGIEDKKVTLYLTKSGQEYGPDRVGAQMATGGQVFGPPGIDKVPAWLTRHEYVMPTSAVDYYGVDFMESIRARKFARGGLVDFAWQLPGVDGIRSTAQSMVDSMAATAAAQAQKEYQKEAAAAAAASPVGGGAPVSGLTAAASAMVNAVLSRFPGQTMTSGYRSPEENRRVGGAPNSDHMYGRAADFAPGSNAVASFLRGYPGIKQVIWQQPGHWDHVHGATTMHQGGIVPGRVGQESLALLEAGERVIPRGGGGSVTLDSASAVLLARALADELREKPIHAVTVASQLSHEMHKARRR